MNKTSVVESKQQKHTPGPWYACANGGDDADTTKCYVATKANRAATTIADCSYPSDPMEMEANAQLISAAPELLEACRLLYSIVRIQNGNLYPDINELQAKAEKAIAKAIGPL